ncbi:hypothetical protein KUTeg_001810 [Tegillarca granosa]|uniref:C2H2-type domain-containing protein n=1 Tax=Tegillarca granosa TaxID=220873 RepID=A0ABQ9FSI6_TEGGR|nr:hypothetical protein KUTeg_001810 [Tegillarca granosa]
MAEAPENPEVDERENMAESVLTSSSVTPPYPSALGMQYPSSHSAHQMAYGMGSGNQLSPPQSYRMEQEISSMQRQTSDPIINSAVSSTSPEKATQEMATSTNSERNHICPNCNKGFKSKQQLAQHSLVHSGIRKYICSYCEKGFKQLCHLQQHTRIHTGEKPYKCAYEGCDRAFAQMSNLHHHMRNHDDHIKKAATKHYQCVICHRAYTNESSLKSHTLKMHVHIKPIDPRADISSLLKKQKSKTYPDGPTIDLTSDDHDKSPARYGDDSRADSLSRFPNDQRLDSFSRFSDSQRRDNNITSFSTEPRTDLSRFSNEHRGDNGISRFTADSRVENLRFPTDSDLSRYTNHHRADNEFPRFSAERRGDNAVPRYTTEHRPDVSRFSSEQRLGNGSNFPNGQRMDHLPRFSLEHRENLSRFSDLTQLRAGLEQTSRLSSNASLLSPQLPEAIKDHTSETKLISSTNENMIKSQSFIKLHKMVMIKKSKWRNTEPKPFKKKKIGQTKTFLLKI